MRVDWLLIACFLAAAPAWGAPQDDFQAGQQAYYKGDVVGAMPVLKRAADAGHAPAQSLYAYILDKAEYNEEAAQYYRRAADQGDPDGQFGLGALYAVGEGVQRDAAMARQWLERAGGQGHGNAIVALSQAFLSENLGYKRDPGDAAGLAWVRKAAELDALPALDYLAKGYRSGAFGAVDVAQAERLEARMRQLSPPPKKAKGRK